MIRRLVSLVLLAWALGFALFAVSLPGPGGAEKTDAIVVLTGGPGRLQRGLEQLAQGRATRLLVSGVDPSVQESELAQLQEAPRQLFACCVDLGKEAIDTRSNAAEASRWLTRRKFKSVRLVTTDWHMRRAHFEMRRQLGDEMRIVVDAVNSEPGFVSLFAEYNKFILRRVSALFGA